MIELGAARRRPGQHHLHRRGRRRHRLRRGRPDRRRLGRRRPRRGPAPGLGGGPRVRHHADPRALPRVEPVPAAAAPPQAAARCGSSLAVARGRARRARRGGRRSARLWVMQQYYVGVDADQVTIFQGVRGDVLGVPLHEVVEHTDLAVDRPHRDRAAASVTDGIIAADGPRRRPPWCHGWLRAMLPPCPRHPRPPPRPPAPRRRPRPRPPRRAGPAPARPRPPPPPNTTPLPQAPRPSRAVTCRPVG